jgi:ABC-2 type transport system permease protein
MSKVWTLARRELLAYLYSPIAYVVAATFLVFVGLSFGQGDFRPGQPASIVHLLETANEVFIFIAPILTMRLVSEEKSRGTIEMLMTAPVTDAQVILGKFLGVLLFSLILVLLTGAHVGVLLLFGTPDVGPMLTGYIGLVLTIMAYLSVGLLISTCTRFQLVSALVSMVILVVFTLICHAVGEIMPDEVRRIIWFVSLLDRYIHFLRGLLAMDDVVYLLSIVATMLFLSVKVLESRKWRA